MAKILQNKRATSKDVAREAGVSQSTVSRVFNNSGISVSDTKKQRILEIAERLGYRPSQIARSLNSQSTKIIGFVISEFESEFYMRVLSLFTKKLQKAGYLVMIFNLYDDLGVEKNLKTALEYQVAGLVITSATLSSPLVEGCLRYKTPVFLFNRISDGLNVNTVCCDNIDGGKTIANYLIDRGHKKLVYISGEEKSSTNRDRKKGFVEQSKSRGLSEVTVLPGNYKYEAGFAAAETLIKNNIEFDGVFCAADAMALGFIDYIKYKTKLRIPEDISIIGFDGIPLNNEIHYPLTTFKQPMERMVDKTIEGLLNKIENFTTDSVHYLFYGQIVVRGSVADRNKK
ncbi:MAG: LacI family DNA-binding transcriptional regulator [Spirochaetia bacterium]|nr:LacI family DNA-binding transcriptional regulator [Spirochaetia bacterium]